MPNRSPIFPGQGWLISALAAMSLNKSKNGVCYGVSHTAMLEILSEENIEEFNEMLFMLNAIFKNRMVEIIKEGHVNNPKAERIQITVEEMFKIVESASETYVQDLLLLIKNAQQKYISIVKAAKGKPLTELNLPVDVKDDEKIVKLTRQYINEDVETLSDLDQKLLKVGAFFESIELLQNSATHKDVFATNYTQYSPEVFEYLESNKIKDKGGIMLASTLSGIYNLDDLSTYFEELQKNFQSGEVKYPICLALSNLNHSITVSYVNGKGWIFVDANHLPGDVINDPKVVASKVLSAFSCKDLSSFSTHVYVTKDNLNDCELRFKYLKESASIQKIHNHKDKALLFDDLHASWLFTASKLGDDEMVEQLLNAKSNPNCVTQNGFTPLYAACFLGNGHDKVVEKLLARGACIDHVISGNVTALYYAVINNEPKVVELLLNAGADPNNDLYSKAPLINIAASLGYVNVTRALIPYIKDPQKLKIAFMIAIFKNDLATTKELFDAGLKYKIFENPACSEVLAYAAGSGNLEIVRLLMTVFTKEQDQILALYRAAQNGHVDIVKELINTGIDLNNQAFNPLKVAFVNNRAEVVKILIAAGADPYAVANPGLDDILMYDVSKGYLESVQILIPLVKDMKTLLSALYFAAKNGQVEVFKELLKLDFKLDVTHVIYPFVLFTAISANKLNIVKVIVENGADINMHLLGDSFPLSLASSFGSIEIMQYLIAKGADINQVSMNGNTALMAAAEGGRVDAIDLLQKSNIDPNQKNNQGDTALILAAQHGHSDAVQKLLAYKANINEANLANETPLFIAAKNGHASLVKLLIENGADLNANVNGKTVYDIALENKHQDVVDLLQQKSGSEARVAADNNDDILILDNANVDNANAKRPTFANAFALFKPATQVSCNDNAALDLEIVSKVNVKSMP